MTDLFLLGALCRAGRGRAGLGDLSALGASSTRVRAHLWEGKISRQIIMKFHGARLLDKEWMDTFTGEFVPREQLRHGWSGPLRAAEREGAFTYVARVNGQATFVSSKNPDLVMWYMPKAMRDSRFETAWS